MLAFVSLFLFYVFFSVLHIVSYFFRRASSEPVGRSTTFILTELSEKVLGTAMEMYGGDELPALTPDFPRKEYKIRVSRSCGYF